MVQMLALPWAIPVVFGCLVGIVAILANMVSNIIRNVSETGLKKRMVDQGFSAAEIERVVRAGAARCPACGYEGDDEDESAHRAKPAKPAKPPKHRADVA